MRRACRSSAAVRSFPPNNWWNTDISQYPLDPNSDAYIAALPGNLHPDFGRESTLRHSVQHRAAESEEGAGDVSLRTQSDPGPYPIPPTRRSRAAGMRAAIATCSCCSKASASCTRCGMRIRSTDGKKWKAGSGALFHLNSNKLRPERLDLGRRRGLTDSAGAGEVRRSAGGRDRPRAARDLRRNADGLHPSRDALRERQP